jgi:DAK2 domain fusion protein YloV
LTVSEARALLAAGAEALEERKQEINDLNVYPVPDGDTGTNLALTMRGILDAVGELPDGLPEKELCAAISQAALMGARGNSGVILSQIIRGAMEILGQPRPVTTKTLAKAFCGATDTAYRAVRKPVEGTMLTVLREMAEAAADIPASTGRKPFIDEVIAAGWQSVEKTPSLLRVLADAGVVDAGGYGLVVLIEGAANGRSDWETPIATHVARTGVPGGFAYEEEAVQEESQYTYCTSLLVSGQSLDGAALEEELGRLGDSLLVVGDSNRIKVHVHTDDPGQVLSLAGRRGILSEIEIDNMREQTAARAQRLAQAGSGPPDGVLTQVVAVVAGEGNKALFRSLGVDLIVDGGQSMNPSAEDLMRAVDRAVAPSVVILPNNGNVIMTAEQTMSLTGRKVYVVPTSSIQAGLTAAVAYEKRSPGEANADEMAAAIANVVTAEVTRAVRDSLVDGVQVHADDYIGLMDDHVVVASSDMGDVLSDLLRQLLEGGRETLTVLLGTEEEARQAALLVKEVLERYPSVEFEVHEGGQPYYPVLLAAE